MNNNVKTFVKEHKTKLIVGGIAVIGGGLLVVGIKHKLTGKVKMPGFVIEGGLTVGDLGKLGEEYMAHDPVLTKETPVVSVGKFIFD